MNFKLFDFLRRDLSFLEPFRPSDQEQQPLSPTQEEVPAPHVVPTDTDSEKPCQDK